MANVATNLFRELFTREPTEKNTAVDETKSELKRAIDRQKCAVVRFAKTVQEVLDDKTAKQ
jgi:hypothetical protein